MHIEDTLYRIRYYLHDVNAAGFVMMWKDVVCVIIWRKYTNVA